MALRASMTYGCAPSSILQMYPVRWANVYRPLCPTSQAMRCGKLVVGGSTCLFARLPSQVLSIPPIPPD
jgi:hypothetical protein